jgi:hypothetical protein
MNEITFKASFDKVLIYVENILDEAIEVRFRTVKGLPPYYASTSYMIKRDDGVSTCFSNGFTKKEAIYEYLMDISGKTLVFHDWNGFIAKTVEIPKLIITD